MKKDYDFLAAPLAALRAGELGRAIQMLTELQMVKPEITDTTYHLGRAHQAAGDSAAARAAFEDVVADPSHNFHSHALARLTELGPGPARNTGVVPPQIEAEAAHNTGVVPPHVEEAATQQAAEPTPDLGEVAQDLAQVADNLAEVASDLAQVAPEVPTDSVATEQAAPVASTGKKGKKGKAGEGESA